MSFKTHEEFVEALKEEKFFSPSQLERWCKENSVNMRPTVRNGPGVFVLQARLPAQVIKIDLPWSFENKGIVSASSKWPL